MKYILFFLILAGSHLGSAKKIQFTPKVNEVTVGTDNIGKGQKTLMVASTDSLEADSIEILKVKVDSLQKIVDQKRQRIRIQPAGENGFFWGTLFGTLGIIIGIIISTISYRRKR